MQKQLDLFTQTSIKQRDPKAAKRLKDEWCEIKRRTHGGANASGKRKGRRPLSSKQWIHLVLKSEHAKERMSFLTARNQVFVETTVRKKADKFGVRVADFANVGNHLHLKIKVTSREGFKKFLKAVTTLIARHVTGARKGKPFGKRFWQGLAYTRVLSSALEELRLRGYVEANRIEAVHSKAARERWLARFNRFVQKVARVQTDTH